ncbi:MAG: putative quinol monooxygenase [Gammaproteobacteria bacterium]
MIIVQARIPVQSDCRNIAYQHVHDFVGHTRGEQGCMGCEAFISLENPDVIMIHQAWRGAEDLDLHAAGVGLDAFLDALPLFVDGEIATLRFDADDAVLDSDGDGDAPSPEEVVIEVPVGVTLH